MSITLNKILSWRICNSLTLIFSAAAEVLALVYNICHGVFVVVSPGVNVKPQKKYSYQVEACQGVWESGSECHGSEDVFFNLGNIQHPREQKRESAAEADSHGPAFSGFEL